MTENEILLTCLAEECMEVAQRVTKALRFGFDEVQPGQSLTNAQRIIGEVNDLMAVVGMLEGRGLPRWGNAVAIGEKQIKVRRYLDYSMGRAANPAMPSEALTQRDAPDA